MRVCIVGNDWKQQFPLINYGGIETAFENLCIGVNKYYKDIKFCAIVPKITERKNSEDYNFNIIETDFIESSKSGLPAYYFGLQAKNIISRSTVKPDVIWCYSAWSAQTLHDLNIPIVCTIMDSGGWEDNKFVYRSNVYYKFCSKFIYDLVFRDADKNENISKIKSQSFWLHSGVSDSEYDLIKEKDDYILWVAGLNWGMTNKGLDIFIELAKMRSDKQFIAYGIGDTNIENQLKVYSKQIKNFEYLGGLQRGDNHKNAFKKAKIFAFLTQIPEAFGMTGLEAITKGTPVLGSTKGAIPELYSRSGICTDNINKMSEAINISFNAEDIFEYSKNFHITNEIQGLIDFSKKII